MPAARSTASRKTAEAEIAVRPINGFIGAEIEGIDLRQPLSPSQFKVVHDALVQYEVIVLRDQAITIDQQMAFGALFGELSIHPFSPNLPDKPEVIILDYSKDNPPALTDIWHVDETFREAPPMATILRGKVVPEAGGDTMFASMSAAYRGLSERMKQHIHGLEALHDFKPWRPLFGETDRP
jgi:taurine dioxygenase